MELEPVQLFVHTSQLHQNPSTIMKSETDPEIITELKFKNAMTNGTIRTKTCKQEASISREVQSSFESRMNIE